MYLFDSVSRLAIVSALGGPLLIAAPASAQTAANIAATNLISGFSLLGQTAAGQAVLSQNLSTSIAINNGATAALRQQALVDNTVAALVGSMNNGLLVADGLGPNLYAAFAAKNTVTRSYTGVGLSANFQTLFSQINTLTVGGDSAFAKNWFANGSKDGNPAHAATGIALPTGGAFNVYDTAYSPLSTNANTVGNSRPVQVAPNAIQTFSGTDFFGSAVDSATGILPTLKSNASFPSGHSAFGFTSSMLLAMMVPERFQQELTRGSEYANSRIVLGAHYALDVIGARIQSIYALVQILNNNPDYLGKTVPGLLGGSITTSNDFAALFASARSDLRALLAGGCGGVGIAACASSSSSSSTDRFADAAHNKATYTYQLTYGLSPVGATNLAPVVPVGAEVLIATRFPYLTAAQRRDVLASTELASGQPLDDGSGYARLNLYAAADGYGALDSQVRVEMNAALGGFNAADSWKNDISGIGGLTLAGTGLLTLTGTDTYTGPTVVDGGMLEVAGSIVSSTTVNAGGVLAGAGRVGDVTVNAGGTLAPGALAARGTLRVNGALTMASGSRFDVRLGATASDLAAVSGAVTLGGGRVAVTSAPPIYTLGTRYTILGATGGITGRFAGVDGRTAFYTLVDHYDSQNVYLDVTKTAAFASAGTTANQIAAATSLDMMPTSNPLFDAIGSLSTTAAAAAAFDQLSGEAHASIRSQMAEDSRFARSAGLDRLRASFGAAGASRTPVMAYADADAALAYGETAPAKKDPAARAIAAPATTDRFAVWSQGIGMFGRVDGSAGSAAVSRSTGGFLIGGDAALFDGAARLGVLGGTGHSTFDIGDRASKGSSEDYHLGVYGGGQWGALGLRAGSIFTWHQIESTRTVAFPGFSNRLTADYRASTTQVFGELGYGLEAGVYAFEPFVDLAHVSHRTDGFGENGGAAALAVRGATTGSTYGTLGLHASTELGSGGQALTLRGTLGWRHAFDDTVGRATVSFAGGTAFTATGTPVAKDALAVDLGVDVALGKSATFGLTYGGQFAARATDQAAKANIALHF